jgi:acyl carrier protein
MSVPTFIEFADFLRNHIVVSTKQAISPSTQFESDLGVTGDDGIELLEAVERHFDINFPTGEDFRKLFNLAPNEFLFHGEGFDGFNLLSWLFSKQNHSYTVRKFTVGELYDVVY